MRSLLNWRSLDILFITITKTKTYYETIDPYKTKIPQQKRRPILRIQNPYETKDLPTTEIKNPYENKDPPAYENEGFL